MSEKDEFSKLVSIKKCPVCSGELIRGYFTIPKGISVFGFDSYDNALALRCERCKIAILDYGTVTRAHTPRSFLKKCVRCSKEIPVGSEYCPKCGAKQGNKPQVK